MRIILFLGTLMLVQIELIAQQIQFKNNSLLHPDTALMYVGVANYIQIEGLKWTKDIFITSSISGATFDEHHIITFIPRNVRRDSIIVYRKGKEIARKYIDSKMIPNPKLNFGQLSLQEKDGKLQAECKADQLIYNPTMKLLMEDCDYKVTPSINTYQVCIYDHEEKLLTQETIAGWLLTFNHLNLIKALKKGGKVIIDNIKVFLPDKPTSPRILQSIQLNIQ